jgi:thiol-disulfide isomerase/thioredoxin
MYRTLKQPLIHSLRFSYLLILPFVLVACSNNPQPAASTSNVSATLSSPGSSASPGSSGSLRSSAPKAPVATGHSSALKNQSFTTQDDRRLQLTQYLGQVVVLDFWATYCPPCLEEVPHLDAMQKKFGPKGLQVIGLNVGGPDDRDKVPGFAKQYSVGYTLAYPEPEMTSFYLQDNDAIPQTFVFDRKGRMLKHFVGFDDSVRAGIESAVQQALSE